MDSLRKKPIVAPIRPIEQPKIVPIIPPSFPKREELYIPKEETNWEKKAEKTFQKKRALRKLSWKILLFMIMIIISIVFFFLWKIYATTKRITTSTQPTTLSQDVQTILSPIMPSTNKYVLRGENEGRINILLLGAAGEHKPGGNLTDTIMIMSIDTKNNKVALLSLPRDLYVPIGESNSFTKINSLYKISLAQNKGADLLKQDVEKITGLTMNYYMVVDFDAFSKIIDDINGINITVERDIYDTTYPGPNYSYELFALKKGTYLLGGDVALKYVRERHDDPEGDFGRAKRQQQVIQSVKSRMFSMQTIFNVVAINNVLDTLGDNIKTDMSFNDIEKFISLSKAVDTQNITNVVIDAWKPDSLLKVSHVMVGDVAAFILVPRVGNYSEINDVAKNIFDQAELKKRQTAIAQENASVNVINQSSDSQLANKIKKLLTEKLNIRDVTITPNTTNAISNKTMINSNSEVEKIFTMDELIKKLPATLDQQKNDPKNDITVTLGNDLVSTYKYEEDSIADFNKAQDSQDNIDFGNGIN